MNEKPLSHQVNIVRIESILVHPNADKLEIIPVGGYQAISAKGQFKVGDLAYYIQPDSIVPEREEYAFVWGNKVIDGGVPEKRRRIAAKKLRGEWSEGLLMPLPPVICVDGDPKNFKLEVGVDLSDNLGITHYNPPEPGAPQEPSEKIRAAHWPKTFRGWYHLIKGWLKGERREMGVSLDLPVYDVTNFKKVRETFRDGEDVIITEKIHGSNGRFVFKQGMFGDGKMYAGSRNLWLGLKSSDAWHKTMAEHPWIEAVCRQYPNFALYGEIVPTQKGFNYGHEGTHFYLFDIRTPDGRWMEHDEVTGLLASVPDIVPSNSRVPLLYRGPWSSSRASLADGLTTTSGKHIREGIVVKAVPERSIRGVGRAQLKIVSNAYLEKDSK
jgi:hypothetical protein